MHPQFTYEEVRRLDALPAARTADPLSPPRRRRRLRRAVRAWLHDRARTELVIDLRTTRAHIEPPSLPPLGGPAPSPEPRYPPRHAGAADRA